MNTEIKVNVTLEIMNRLVHEFINYVESQKAFDDVVDDHFLSDSLLSDPNAFYNTISTLLGSETYRNKVRTNFVLKVSGKEYDHRLDDGINAIYLEV